MKINKVHFEDHPFFGTLDIDFSGSHGSRSLNTVVIAGINGSGKTTLLDAVVDMMTDADNRLEKSYVNIELTELYEKELLHREHADLSVQLGFRAEHERLRDLFKFNAGKKDENSNLIDKFKHLEDSEKPRIAHMPTMINISKIKPKINPYVYKYKFLNIVDENVAQDVPNYFATDIDRGVYSSDQKPAAESIKKVCDEINSIFKELEMESWIIGLKKDGSRMPIFRNRIGKEFDITGLSSGERQLFFRIMSLRMMQINNSIILVDEPEISLHPSWQQRIIKVYENIGKNNQVIVATHSPHVVSSVPNESIRILLVDPPDIKVLDHGDIRNSYGASIKRVLKDIMFLKSDRDPEIQSRIDGLKNDLKRDDYDPAKFETSFNELEEILGTTDEELIRIKMEMLRKEKKARDAENR